MNRFYLPLILSLAFVLGGSVQQPRLLLGLYLLSITLMAWAYAYPSGVRTSSRGPQLLVLGWSFLFLAAFQLVPLPTVIWTEFPGRALAEHGDQTIGLVNSWRSLSLAPEATLATLVGLTVPLAVLAVGVKLPLSRTATAIVVVSIAIVCAIWGLAQWSGAAGRLQPFTSSGPTGPFANTNHLATLLVAALPFVAAIVAAPENKGRATEVRLIGIVVALGLVAVTLQTGARAMIGALVFVLPLSLFIATRSHKGPSGRLTLTFALIGATIVAWSMITGRQDLAISAGTRTDIWERSLGLHEFMVIGGGFGSFPHLYALVEDPFLVDRFVVNHVHNDVLEFAIESGVPGLLLLIVGLVWLASLTARIWTGAVEADPYARAATVAVGVILLHSLVDFPLRTSAHQALLATCLVLIATHRAPKPTLTEGDLRPTRHRHVL